MGMLNTHVSYPRGCMQSMGCVFLLRNGLGIRFEKKFCKLPHIVALHFKNINSQLCINFLFLFCIKRRNFGALRLFPKNTDSSEHLQEKDNGNPNIKLWFTCFVMKNMKVSILTNLSALNKKTKSLPVMDLNPTSK